MYTWDVSCQFSVTDTHPSWEPGPLPAEHSAWTWPVEPAADKVAAWLLWLVFAEAESWA